MVDTATDHGVWSTAFYRCLTRLLVVGVIAGAATGMLLVVSTSLLEGFDLLVSAQWGLLAAGVGMALAVPTALLSAATGLTLAVRTTKHLDVAVGLVALWPALLTAATTRWWSGAGGLTLPQAAWVVGGVLVTLVVAAVVVTHRWVLAPSR